MRTRFSLKDANYYGVTTASSGNMGKNRSAGGDCGGAICGRSFQVSILRLTYNQAQRASNPADLRGVGGSGSGVARSRPDRVFCNGHPAHLSADLLELSRAEGAAFKA